MEKKNCPCKGLLRAFLIIAAVIGAIVAVEAILERVFKKYLKITIELDDIDNLDDECDFSCEYAADEDDIEAEDDEACSCDCCGEPEAE